MRQGLTGSMNENGTPTKISKLAALAKARAGNRQPTSGSLASIGLLGRISSESPKKDSTSLKPSLSGLTRLGKPKLPAEETSGATPVKSAPKKEKPRKCVKCFPDLDLDVSLVKATMSPSLEGLIFGLSTKTVYQAPHVANTVLLDTAAKEAFEKPSPDDVVLSAQQKGFTDKLANLKVADTKPPESPKRFTPKLDIDQEVAKANAKHSVNFVVIGHVDAGKSTLMGRMLYDVGAVDKHIIDKYTKESGSIGKGSFALAWVMDQTEEERKRGVTIDICMSTFETPSTKFTIVDAPGHRDFVPNMIAGSSQADFAVLVVDSATDAFESGFNLDGQTKEHAILVRSLGVDRIIVAVNKLDTVGWSQDRFDEIRVQLIEFLTRVGFSLERMSFIPTSGLNGDNVVNRKELAWYSGPTLLGQLEMSQSRSSQKDHKKSFRMIVTDVYNAPHTSDLTVHGRIDGGSIQVEEMVKVSPSGVASQIRSIVCNSEPRPWAIAGDNVVLNLSNVELDQISVGDVLANSDSVLHAVNRFTCRIVTFEMKRPILQGTKMILHRGRTNEPCKIIKMVATVDKATGHVVKKKPRHLASGQTAIVQIELDEGTRIPVETFVNSKELGRFVLRKEGSTVAAGVVDELN
jgi:elongation factor 1 alpha-like protein